VNDLLPLDLGDGLVLHESTVADTEEVYLAIDADRDRLREWLPWVDATSSLAVQREFLASLEAANAAGTGLHVTLRQDTAFAGVMGLRINGMHGSADVGYWVATAYAGRGLVTRSVAALVDLAFGPLGLHRVELRAATANDRSRAVAQRLGLVHEGTLREAELLARGHVDLEVYSVLAAEWPSDRGGPSVTAVTLARSRRCGSTSAHA
jgi:ribosomal-protein-serine acetyltransferase